MGENFQDLFYDKEAAFGWRAWENRGKTVVGIYGLGAEIPKRDFQIKNSNATHSINSFCAISLSYL